MVKDEIPLPEGLTNEMVDYMMLRMKEMIIDIRKEFAAKKMQQTVEKVEIEQKDNGTSYQTKTDTTTMANQEAGGLFLNDAVQLIAELNE
ncbi:hypothetical protein CANINC_001568, partial [Pichia inconspicua]